MKLKIKFFSFLIIFLALLSNYYVFAVQSETTKSQTPNKNVISQNTEPTFSKLLKETDPKIINALERASLEMNARFTAGEVALTIGTLSLIATVISGICGSNIARGTGFNILSGLIFSLVAGLAGGAITVTTYGLLKILELYKRRRLAKKFAKIRNN